MSFNIRLNNIRLWTGLNPTKFGETLKNTHTENVRVLLNGKHSNPGLQVIADVLTTYPQINPRWLILGEGEMLIKEEELSVVEEPQEVYLKMMDKYGDLKQEFGILQNENKHLKAEIEKLKGGSGQEIPEEKARTG